MNDSLISVSSRLIQNYHVGEPISAGTKIATFKNRFGQVEVLSIGSDFNLYNIYPDENSDTGWSVMKVELPEGLTAKDVVACNILTDDEGGPAALVKLSEAIKKEGFKPIPMIALFRTGRPGTAFTIMYIPLFKGQSADTKSWKDIKITIRSNQVNDQEVYLTFLYNNNVTSTVSRIFIQFDPEQKPTVNTRLIGNVYSHSPQKYIVINYKPKNSNELVPITVYQKNNGIDGDSKGKKYPPSDAFPKNEPTSQFSAAGIPNAFFNISSQDKRLGYIRTIPGDNKSDWHDIDLSRTKRFESVIGTANKNGRPQAFSLGTDGNLYQIENLSTDDMDWSKQICINNDLQISSYSVSKSGDGSPIVFIVDNDHRLYRIWQDSMTLEWHKDEIEIEIIDKEKRKAEEFNSYSTEITVFDSGKLLRPNAKVKLWSSGEQSLIVNGKGYLLNPGRPVEVLSNYAGKVSIISETNELATSLLTVWTEFMDDDKGVAIEPNGYIQEKFASITASDLLEAKGAQGDLLKGKYRGNGVPEALASALNNSMAPLQASAQSQAERRFSNYSNVISGANCFHISSESFGMENRINFSQVVSKPWMLSFNDEGLPIYKELDEAEVKRGILIAKQHDSHDIGWGGLWQMIKEGACNLISYLSNQVMDGLQVVIKYLKDGLTYVWEGIVNIAEQVFQAVLTFFNKVEVYFEDIMNWLGTTFNWHDILRTREVINHSVNTVFDFFDTTIIPFLKQKVDTKITEIKNEIHTTIEQYVEMVGEDPIFEKENPVGGQGPLNFVENNIIINAVVNNHDGCSNLMVPTISKVDSAFMRIKSSTESFESSDAFIKAEACFNAIKDNPDKILELVMKGLLELVEAILLWGLEKIHDILFAVLDAINDVIKSIKQLLNSPFYFPLVSEIYNLVNEQELGTPLPFSYLDVVSLMVAAPATVIYTVSFGKGPFVDGQSVNSFKELYNEEWLEEKFGIKNPKRRTREIQRNEIPDHVSFCNILAGTIYAISAIVKPIVDDLTIADEAVPGNITKHMVLRFFSGCEASLSTMNWFASIPWLLEPQEEYGTQGFEVQATIWGSELILDVGCDWLFFFVEPEGKVESTATTAFSSILLVNYISLAIIDSKRAYNISKTIPGVLAIFRPIAAMLRPYGPIAGGIVFTLAGAVCNGVMAGYSFSAAKG